MSELAPRLRRLPRVSVLGLEIPVAVGAHARLLGLAHLDRAEAGAGLLIPSCASVHTFGMRFALDLYSFDGSGGILAVRHAVPARRVVFHRGAVAILEIPAAEGGENSPPCP